MSESRDLPSLTKFAWDSWLVIQLALLMANLVLSLLQVSVRLWGFNLKHYVEPWDYFRALIALLGITFIFIFFAWFWQVKSFRERRRHEGVVIQPGQLLSDEEEAELRAGSGWGISQIVLAVMCHIPATILNLYLLRTTPFVLD